MPEDLLNLNADDDDGDTDARVHSFEILPKLVEQVRRRCNEIEYPLIEEFDFHNDRHLPPLKMDLRQSAVIRPY